MSERLPAHTPYDGAAKLFTIGLKPLDPARWIETHPDLPILLAEKARLDAAGRDAVFVEEPDTREAQREVLDLLVGHLLERHAGTYSRTARGIAIRGADAPVPLQTPGEPPLVTAARLVGDDLLLMRRGAEGWRLAAGSLSFPSSWSLREKFGRPLHIIHKPVPGFGPGTRMAEVIARIFDNLAAESSVERWNWSIQADSRLHVPFSNTEREERAAARAARFAGLDPVAAAFIRVERQTLRKLPGSRDILFTVRIHLDPMGLLRAHPERQALARSFAAQLRALLPEQLDYKGLAADRDHLAEALDRLAEP